MKNFVIIGGAPRSGTNLLRRIVGSHSSIAIPPGEFQLFNQIANGKTLQQVLKNARLEKWGVDLAAHFDDEPGTAFVRILEKYALSVGKEIPGEKTPFNEFYYAEIMRALKDYDYRFIHMVRDPFDVMASYKHMGAMKGRSGLNDISIHLRNWVDSVTLGLHRNRENPDQYRFLRYEDLLNDPDTVTRQLCEFIGVDYEKDRMLTMADYSGHKDNTSFPDASTAGEGADNPIKAHVSRKNHLNRAEIRHVVQTCGAKALEAGYTDPDFAQTQKTGGLRSRINAIFSR